MDSAASYELLAFESSRSRLDKQDHLLEELRSRTGVLLAAAALAASFLGREAFSGHPRAELVVAALASFLISMAASLYILVPRNDKFVFSLVGSGVYEGLYEWRDDLAEVYRRLTYDLDRFWTENDDHMKKVRTAYRLGTGALVAEILVLSAMVSDTFI